MPPITQMPPRHLSLENVKFWKESMMICCPAISLLLISTIEIRPSIHLYPLSWCVAYTIINSTDHYSPPQWIDCGRSNCLARLQQPTWLWLQCRLCDDAFAPFARQVCWHVRSKPHIQTVGRALLSHASTWRSKLSCKASTAYTTITAT